MRRFCSDKWDQLRPSAPFPQRRDRHMMALSIWSLPAIDPKYVVLLEFLSPFVIGFLAVLPIYSWMSKPGWQAADFSPTLASVLSTPILAFPWFCFVLARDDAIHRPSVLHTITSTMGIFAPVFLILPTLLVIYLRRVTIERSKVSNINFSASVVACLLLQSLWLYFLAYLGEGS
jgi:hypothetical protein